MSEGKLFFSSALAGLFALAACQGNESSNPASSGGGGPPGAHGGRNDSAGGAGASSGGVAAAGGSSNGGRSAGAPGAGGSPAGGAAGSGNSAGKFASGGATSAGGALGAGGSAGSNAAGGVTAAGGAGQSGGASQGPASMVDASHVRLLPGSPFYERQDLHRKGYLASLDADKLLFEYRKLANVPQANGVTGGYAGWDTGFIKGHMLGHYLSAASRMAAATGDTSFKTKVDYVVAELAKCQAGLGDSGYLAAFPTAAFDWVEGKPANNAGIVVPYYTVHKIMAGLLDAHRYVANQQALEIVRKMADYFQTRLAALSAATIESTFRTDGNGNPQNEFGAMSDVYSELSSVTGEKKYLDTAKIFNRSWFIDPLAQGQDKLKGLHGNTHIAQALGIAHTANLSGDTASLRASENFWKLLSGKHAFVMGGDSFHEWLDGPGVETGASVDGGKSLPPTTAETCNTHNMLKLTSLLFARAPRSEYADYYERALYNHVLASIASDTGDVTYFTPLYGQFRTYIKGTFCDNGTGIESTPRYNEGIYFESGDSLWVNLYIPNELIWDAAGLTLRQEGNAAVGETVQLSVVRAASPVHARLNLRIPSWVSGSASLSVNGTPLQQSLAPSSYVALDRTWSAGDVVTLKLPAGLRLEHAQDSSSMVAVFFGPVLLAGALGRDNMPNDVADKDAYLSTAPVSVPKLATSSANPGDWLTASGTTPLTYKAHDVGAASGITFRPLYDVHHERYSVYWPLQAQ